MFSGIWSGIKAVLGVSSDGQSNVMKVASGIGNWIDKQQFTDQEKAQYNAQMVDQYAKFMESTVNESSERSITRRSIAIWIIRTEIALLIASIVLYQFNQPLSEYIYKVATTNPMEYLVLGVGAFFFGAHIIRATQGK